METALSEERERHAEERDRHADERREELAEERERHAEELRGELAERTQLVARCDAACAALARWVCAEAEAEDEDDEEEEGAARGTRRIDWSALPPCMLDDKLVGALGRIPRVAQHLVELFLPAAAPVSAEVLARVKQQCKQLAVRPAP